MIGAGTTPFMPITSWRWIHAKTRAGRHTGRAVPEVEKSRFSHPCGTCPLRQTVALAERPAGGGDGDGNALHEINAVGLVPDGLRRAVGPYGPLPSRQSSREAQALASSAISGWVSSMTAHCASL